jgi:hypothetical protein
MARHARAHLLTGEYGLEDNLREERRGRLMLLKGLAHTFCRSGDYAVTVLRDRGAGDFAMIGIEHREDFNRISQAVRARTAPAIGSWRTHRSFGFDAAAYRRIALVLVSGGTQGVVLKTTKS